MNVLIKKIRKEDICDYESEFRKNFKRFRNKHSKVRKVI